MRTTSLHTGHEVSRHSAAGHAGARRDAAHAALLAAAPFIGLAWIVLLPFIGAAAALWMLLETVVRSARVRRALAAIGALVAAPFIGLAFIVALPLAGLVTLLTMECKAVAAAAHAA